MHPKRHVLCALLLVTGLELPSMEAVTPPSLAVAGRRNATPWIATAGRWVAVAWGATLKDQTDVFVAMSRDGGATFGTPARVDAIRGEARLGGELPPRVALHATGDGVPEVVVVWTARGMTTDIRLARSRDGGETFSRAISLQAPGAPGDRGWPSLALDPTGRVHALWVDHRGLAQARGHEQHHDRSHQAGKDAAAAAVAMAQGSAVYASSGDERSERVVAASVCYCCKTTVAVGPDGALHAAWRHVFPGSVRDVVLSTSRDGGTTFSPPARVSDDGWAINGCPDNGPSLAVGRDGTVHVVWPTLDGERPALFFASTRDGRRFTPRLRVPTRDDATPSHPQIVATGSGTLALAWDESGGGRRSAVVRGLTVGDSPAWGPAVSLGQGTYPVLAAGVNGELLAAWATPDGAGITVRPVRLH
jgi:hypothetical protein